MVTEQTLYWKENTEKLHNFFNNLYTIINAKGRSNEKKKNKNYDISVISNNEKQLQFFCKPELNNTLINITINIDKKDRNFKSINDNNLVYSIDVKDTLFLMQNIQRKFLKDFRNETILTILPADKKVSYESVSEYNSYITSNSKMTFFISSDTYYSQIENIDISSYTRFLQNYSYIPDNLLYSPKINYCKIGIKSLKKRLESLKNTTTIMIRFEKEKIIFINDNTNQPLFEINSNDDDIFDFQFNSDEPNELIIDLTLLNQITEKIGDISESIIISTIKERFCVIELDEFCFNGNMRIFITPLTIIAEKESEAYVNIRHHDTLLDSYERLVEHRTFIEEYLRDLNEPLNNTEVSIETLERIRIRLENLDEDINRGIQLQQDLLNLLQKQIDIENTKELPLVESLVEAYNNTKNMDFTLFFGEKDILMKKIQSLQKINAEITKIIKTKISRTITEKIKNSPASINISFVLPMKQYTKVEIISGLEDYEYKNEDLNISVQYEEINETNNVRIDIFNKNRELKQIIIDRMNDLYESNNESDFIISAENYSNSLINSIVSELNISAEIQTKTRFKITTTQNNKKIIINYFFNNDRPNLNDKDKKGITLMDCGCGKNAIGAILINGELLHVCLDDLYNYLDLLDKETLKNVNIVGLPINKSMEVIDEYAKRKFPSEWRTISSDGIAEIKYKIQLSVIEYLHFTQKKPILRMD